MTKVDDDIQSAIDEFTRARKDLIKVAFENDLERVAGCRKALKEAISSCKSLGLDPTLISNEGTYEGELE